MEIVFGHRVKSSDDVFLQIASKGGRTIAAAGAVGSHIVDLIPPCMKSLSVGLSPNANIYVLVRFIPDWFPGAGFKRLPPGTREALLAMRDVPFNDVKRRMVSLLSYEHSYPNLPYRWKERLYPVTLQTFWRKPNTKMKKVSEILALTFILVSYQILVFSELRTGL